MQDCDGKYTVLIVDGDKLKADGIYNAWMTDKENMSLFCNLSAWDRKGHDHETIIVSMERFWDMDEQIYWLRKNQKYICYDESYAFIEKLRIVDATDPMMAHLQLAAEHPVFFSKIMSDSGIQLSDLFDQFLTVYMNGSDEPVFDKSPDFSVDPTCLSMPFLSCLFYNHKNVIIDPLNCEFLFKCVNVEYYGKMRKIVSFRLRYDGNLVGDEYYDYSTQPGTAIAFKNYFV